jgi:hypothetical protein
MASLPTADDHDSPLSPGLPSYSSLSMVPPRYSVLSEAQQDALTPATDPSPEIQHSEPGSPNARLPLTSRRYPSPGLGIATVAGFVGPRAVLANHQRRPRVIRYYVPGHGVAEHHVEIPLNDISSNRSVSRNSFRSNDSSLTYVGSVTGSDLEDNHVDTGKNISFLDPSSNERN